MSSAPKTKSQMSELEFQREFLRLELEGTSYWRSQKAAEHPDDERNLEAVTALDRLAESVKDINPFILRAYSEFFEDRGDVELHSEMMRQIGFSYSPETAEEFCKNFIANRTDG